MLRRNNNVTTTLLTNATIESSTLPANGTVVTPSNLAKGAVVITDLGLKRTTTALASMATGEQFFIVQGCGSTKPLLKSPILTKERVAVTSKKHIAAVQQISTIGFDGTSSGELPAANNTSFFVKIRKNDNDNANQSQPESLFAQHKTDASGTQEELATGLVKNGIKNFKDEPANGYLAFETICNNAGVANTVVAGTDLTHFSFVKGSRVVTGTDSAGVELLGTDEVIDVIVAGDYLRAGTSKLDSIYLTTAITDGTATTPATITLDIPYQGESTIIAYGSTEYISAANAAAADWGVKLTGLAKPFDVNAFRNYYVNRFTATFSNEDTLVSHNRGAYSGNGVWQQVAMDEYMSYGFEGQNEMLAIPPRTRDQIVKIPGVGIDTAATSRYSPIQVTWTETIDGLVSLSGAKGSVIIYCNLNSSGNLATSPDNVGETLATQLGITASDLDA